MRVTKSLYTFKVKLLYFELLKKSFVTELKMYGLSKKIKNYKDKKQ